MRFVAEQVLRTLIDCAVCSCCEGLRGRPADPQVIVTQPYAFGHDALGISMVGYSSSDIESSKGAHDTAFVLEETRGISARDHCQYDDGMEWATGSADAAVINRDGLFPMPLQQRHDYEAGGIWFPSSLPAPSACCLPWVRSLHCCPVSETTL